MLKNISKLMGPFQLKLMVGSAQQVEETRNAIAFELNTTPDTITLTEDVTVGCNIALWGINWQIERSHFTYRLRTSRHYRYSTGNWAQIWGRDRYLSDYGYFK